MNKEVLEWKNEGVEMKVGNNAGQSKHPIIKITFYLCLKKKRLQNIKLNNFGV